MNKEIWKDIKGYEGLYQVSNYGRIINYKSKRILKGRVSFGYLRITLYKYGKAKTFMVHRLVAEAFISNPNKLPQINHKDENKMNNNVNNLEWCNSQYNINYGKRNEIVSKKLTNHPKKSKKIRCVETGIVYSSSREIERELGYFHSNILACCNGKRKTRGGYHWEYV